MRTPEELGEALVAILRDPPPPGLRPQLDWFLRDDAEQLARHAVHHRVAPFLRQALRGARLSLAGDVSRALEKSHARFTAVHLMALEDLTEVGDILRQVDVEALVMKGPVLAERHYPSADLRPYGDLDLLIPPADFERTIDALEAAGLELVDKNWHLIRTEGRAQLHVVLPHGTLADIHWSVLNRRSVRDTFRIPTLDLLARARSVEIDGRSVPTLDPTDTLLHLCLHGTLSGGDRLIWSKDVERVIATEPPRWDEVVRRADAWMAGPSVAIALDRARRILGADVPTDVLRDLYGSGIRGGITRLVDHVRPPERALGEMNASVLWSQVCRADWRTTLEALSGRASRRSRHLLKGGSYEGSTIFRPVGDARDERRYLEEVEDLDRGDADGSPRRP
ncbi:MAG TPA: nucleotidyltransferase family protein [Actinomycetota bacterium]|nr:nucleotidyltransferase family protein [Actinomycetota bacterium]